MLFLLFFFFVAIPMYFFDIIYYIPGPWNENDVFGQNPPFFLAVSLFFSRQLWWLAGWLVG